MRLTIKAKSDEARTKRLPAATALPWLAIARVPVRRCSIAGVLALQIGSTRIT
jgi:hypothetical protein